MSKRRRASEMIWGKSHVLRYPATVIAVTSGTGTQTSRGVITVVASNVATQTYMALTSGTNIATLVGTASGGF